jgi:hypothetical protein
MRRVWAFLCLLVVAAGAAGVAGEFSGRVLSLSSFALDPFHLDLETVIEVDWSESGWTLGATASFTEHEFEFVFLDAVGSLGAVDLYSVAGFETSGWYAAGPLFEYWNSVASVSIAGLDLYAIALLSNHWYYGAHRDDGEDLPNVANEVGIGLRMGGWGSVGDVTIYGELQFNVDSYGDTDGPYWIWTYGFDDFVPVFLGHVNYGDDYGWSYWYWSDSEFTPHRPTCSLPWSGADFVLLAPFTCLDLYVGLGFTCDVGFDYLDLFVEHIDLGLSWLELAYFDIWFETDSKEVSWAPDLVVADSVCIKPYLSLDTGGNSVGLDGLALNALTLEYEVSPGVTLKAGEKFTEDEWFDYVTWAQQWWDGWTAWGEIAAWHDVLWEYGWDGIWDSENEEYFALEIAGGSCCAGRFDVFIYNWFDIEQTGVFMDWYETIAGVRLGIGSNTTLILTLFVSSGGDNYVDVGMDFVW